MALAALGPFIFTLQTIPFHGWDEETTWRHPSKKTVGSMNQPGQFTGRDNKIITISAELRPEISGGDKSIMVLEKMADTGEPWPLIRGDGRFKGSFVINSISRSDSELMSDGRATSIGLKIVLEKQSDQPLGLLGDALGIVIGAARGAFNV